MNSRGVNRGSEHWTRAQSATTGVARLGLGPDYLWLICLCLICLWLICPWPISAPVIGIPIAHADSVMGDEKFSAICFDSTYVLFLRDRAVPAIPWLEVDPAEISVPSLSYAERLAIFANARIPMFVKIRDSQQRNEWLWVIGHLEPRDGDYERALLWPPDQRLCATLAGGTEICADSVFVVTAGRAIDPLTPICIYPRGWAGSYASVLVEHPGVEYCMIYAAFPMRPFLREKLTWKDCTGIRLPQGSP